MIATVKNDYGSKFGVPRQASLSSKNESLIVFEKEYSVNEAVRGLEEFGRIWVIWEFSENKDKEWTPTVRPPKLGGNKRIGVFATRSPFRPNPIGLSCVELVGIEKSDGKIALRVKGADMIDGTPVYDIKPYIPYADSFPDSPSSFAVDGENESKKLDVIIDSAADTTALSKDKLEALIETLSFDPRPGYSDDENKIFAMTYAGCNVKFKVKDKTLVILKIEKE